MCAQHPCYDPDDPQAVECYRTALRALTGAGVDFMVGGAYAFARVAGTARHTKDLDLFLRRRDRDRALAELADAGFQTEVTYPHWLAKAKCGDYFIDLIYDSGNGATCVDDGWFAHAARGEVMGLPVLLFGGINDASASVPIPAAARPSKLRRVICSRSSPSGSSPTISRTRQS